MQTENASVGTTGTVEQQLKQAGFKLELLTSIALSARKGKDASGKVTNRYHGQTLAKTVFTVPRNLVEDENGKVVLDLTKPHYVLTKSQMIDKKWDNEKQELVSCEPYPRETVVLINTDKGALTQLVKDDMGVNAEFQVEIAQAKKAFASKLESVDPELAQMVLAQL